MLVDNASMGQLSTFNLTILKFASFVTSKILALLRQQCRAREATSQYVVVFLNNDMWIDPEFVHGLVKAVQSAPDVCAGAKILN